MAPDPPLALKVTDAVCPRVVVVVGGNMVVVVVGGGVGGLLEVDIPHTARAEDFHWAHVACIVLVLKMMRGPIGSKPSTTAMTVL
jgi:hypothetical protein